MIARPLVPIGRLALLAGAALVAFAAMGCDAGGLLVAEHSTIDPTKPALGPSANELVSGGTFASNSKYRLFYVVGQPTPNQGVSKSQGHRDHGGLIGAVNSD